MGQIMMKMLRVQKEILWIEAHLTHDISLRFYFKCVFESYPSSSSWQISECYALIVTEGNSCEVSWDIRLYT